MSCGGVVPYYAWATRRPIALSDTANNLLIETTPAQFIHNRNSAAVMANIRFLDGTSSPLPIAGYGTFQGGTGWVGVNQTGTTASSGTAYETILATAANSGGNFGNQPANDGVEVLSSSAADTTQTVTIYGTTNNTNTMVAETVALTGITFVATTKTDWGIILGVELSAACAGTITVREASADQTITTIAPASTSAGVQTVTASPGSLNAGLVMVAAGGASTKQIGLIGTTPAGVTRYDSQALTGTTAVAMNLVFGSVTKVLVGDLATATTVTVSNGSDLVALF
jgi:hypothetical protein